MTHTVASLYNPARKSKYDFVATHDAWTNAAGERGYRAQYQRVKPNWYGPLRRSAEAAAQDAANKLNGQGAAPATSPTLKTAGHPRAKPTRKVSKAERVALDIVRDQRARRNPRSRGYIYCVAEKGCKRAVKVGWTRKTPPASRLGDYQTGNPRLLVMVAYFEGRPRDERALHAKYIKQNILGEWFRPTPALLSEFGLTKEALNT